MATTTTEENDLKHHQDKKSTIVTSEIREKKRNPIITVFIACSIAIYTIGTSFAGFFLLMVMQPYFVSLGLSESQATATQNLCAFGSIAFLISIIVGGSISDDIRSRFGNRLPMVLLGGTIAGLSHIIAPFILSKNTILLAPVLYIIFYIGAGFAYSPLLALLSELFTKEERVWAGMVIGAVAVIGTAIASVVLTSGSIDYIQKWLITGVALVAGAIITFILTPKTNPDFPPDETIADIIRTPIYLFKLGGGRNFLIMFFVQALWGASIYVINLNMRPFLIGKVTEQQVVAIMFMVGIGGVIFAVPVGIIINKLGKTKGALVGTLILALYTLMLMVFDQFEVLLIVAIMGGIGTVFIQTVAIALPADIVPEGKEGQFMGIFTFAKNFPEPLMAAVSIGVITSGGALESLFFIVVILLIVAGFLLLGLNYENMLEEEYTRWYKRYLEFRGLVKFTIGKGIAKIDSSTSLLKNKIMRDSL
ncbi:MAG: MFS transporter [Candidatus Odinarchaeota archaeon]